ncbi:glycosyltransferase family 2 protein [Pedobacter sp. MC2016-05]|uniref:glycosyltransferase family 2 protein n=1 Tax=Pedobacter sp. MC2016-05 TaxID=2994474 RepID=UPI002245D46E|nr:glycosyltransferase family 2 protein [Pedobacter sp. MC2016-05]MCX2473220.1 glycosyltransferase family 2 protein [Pedobacter sp. MC2016-05]
MVKFKRIFFKQPIIEYAYEELPSCTLIVAAYNEEGFIEEKIKDTLKLSYPPDKLKLIFVTDGSTDRTPFIVSQSPQITLLHSAERNGKIAAVHRAMEHVKSSVVVFTDANTYLHQDSLIELCKHFADDSVGGVAGEKKIFSDAHADATAGEGIYWKYESKLKAWDAELYTVVGAAGELFSIRTALYSPVPKESILDDFMISMGIAERGFKIKYEPKAFAQETSSVNIKEELKRKIRIAAGGFQSIIWLKSILVPFKNPVLTFQYVSHRVLRWTLTPLALIVAFFSNLYVLFIINEDFYIILFILQCLFYLSALMGMWMERKQVRLKVLFVPYYFCLMNYAIIAGGLRYFRGHQSAIWEKSARK